MKNVIILCFIFITFFKFSDSTAQELYGLVVIIDPGHGGDDPGAIGYFGNNKQKITESSYCYDVTLRLEKLLKNKGAIVFMTVKGNQTKPINNDPQKIIEIDNSKTLFSLDNKIVEAGSRGLSKRVSFANIKFKKYPRHKVVYISIHFDVIAKLYSGARIIEGAKSDKLADCLKTEMELSHRLNMYENPILKNGDKTHGIRNLYVLGSKNKIPQKVLIELGNFNNNIDSWRIRDPKVREDYALIITKSLVSYMSK